VGRSQLAAIQAPAAGHQNAGHRRRPAACRCRAWRHGKELREGHDHDYRRSCDRWLLEFGDGNVLVADCGLLGVKDADEALIKLGPEALRQLVERAVPAVLSGDGWIRRLGGMGDVEYDHARAEIADALGVRRATLDNCAPRVKRPSPARIGRPIRPARV
jgi:hypothetical protein